MSLANWYLPLVMLGFGIAFGIGGAPPQSENQLKAVTVVISPESLAQIEIGNSAYTLQSQNDLQAIHGKIDLHYRTLETDESGTPRFEIMLRTFDLEVDTKAQTHPNPLFVRMVPKIQFHATRMVVADSHRPPQRFLVEGTIDAGPLSSPVIFHIRTTWGGGKLKLDAQLTVPLKGKLSGFVLYQIGGDTLTVSLVMSLYPERRTSAEPSPTASRAEPSINTVTPTVKPDASYTPRQKPSKMARFAVPHQYASKPSPPRFAQFQNPSSPGPEGRRTLKEWLKLMRGWRESY